MNATRVIQKKKKKPREKCSKLQLKTVSSKTVNFFFFFFLKVPIMVNCLNLKFFFFFGMEKLTPDSLVKL